MLTLSFIRPILTACAAAAITGCLLLPIPNTREETPGVKGRLLDEDGTPMAGVAVAVTSGGTDASCADSRARGITDPQGRFTLPRDARHHSWYPFTMFESFGRAWYGICAGTPEDSTLRYRGPVQGMAGSDELDCLQWRFDVHTRITCNTLASRPVYFGGTWGSGPRRGFYRIILADDLVHWRWSFGFIQWVATDPATGRSEVRATTWLPKSPSESLERGPALLLDGGHWYITGLRSEHGLLLRHREARLELGGPGELWRLP
jgi:hypothetical protein